MALAMVGAGARAVTTPELDATIAASPCPPKAQAALKAWNPQGPWTRALATRPHEKLFRSPTDVIGKWVEASFSPERTELRLFNAGEILRIGLGRDCKAQAGAIARNTRDRFGRDRARHGFRVLRDQDVANIVGAGSPGVFFLWSPHYKISVEGLRQFKEAADRMQVPIFALVEPTSTPSAVRAAARSLEIPTERIYWMNSFDLQNRGIRLHFPSLIVFNGGRYASQVRRGFEESDVYFDYLKNHL